jgi:three-Cys-motif partner protein
MMRRARRDYFITVPEDGLPAHLVGPWAEEKYRYVGMYAELFATGMKNRWKRRVYLDLFSGPGYSQIRGTPRFVLGSPLIALGLPDPFDAYIFADESPGSVAALNARVIRGGHASKVAIITGDANEKVNEIVELIPGPGGGRPLSFCFLDPFKLNIHFDTVRRLADGRDIDFVILLALYVDANRNIKSYIRDESPTIDRFLGDRTWRDEWREAEGEGASIVEYLAKAYSTRMAAIGYLPMRLEEMVKIRSYDRRLPLYYLAFFSRHKAGLKFWREVLRYATDQLSLL